MSKSRPSLLNAFNDRYRVDNRGCWLWTGMRGKGGYGVYIKEKIRRADGGYDRRRIYAHRLAWELYFGEIPDELEVCHKCDVTRCVNPDHLFLGTHAQNQRDMVRKGRQAYGRKQGSARITEDDVIAIRGSRETLAVLAERYGIAFQTISEIKNRKIWQHVAGKRIDDPKDNQIRKGSRQGSAKLQEHDIPVIRRRLANGESCAAIARDYEVSDVVIGNIKRGKNWTHVK